MSLTLRDNGSNFELAPEGSFPAVCYRIIDLGTQPNTFEGKTTYKHKVIIAWELHGDERMTDGRPFSVSKKYTASLSSKATLRKHLAAWRGRDFNGEELAGFQLKTLLGKACFLQVQHDEKGDRTYANIGSIMKLPKGVPAPEPENDIQFFEIDDPDMELFESFSERLKEIIEAAPEWRQRGQLAPVSVDDLDDDSDIPF